MTNTTTASNYKIAGSGDDETTCACCGRTDLNRVIWLTELDADGNAMKAEAYGTTCAARLLAPKSSASQARTLTKLAKALAFVAKWADSEYTLDQIRDTIAVKFSVRGSVEGDTLSVLTDTGWITVVSR